MSASVTFTSATSGRRIVAIRRNGVEVQRTEITSGSLTTLTTSAAVLCAGGDTIDVSVFVTGATVTLGNPCRVQIAFIG